MKDGGEKVGAGFGNRNAGGVNLQGNSRHSTLRKAMEHASQGNGTRLARL